jgi:hypothetical protein
MTQTRPDRLPDVWTTRDYPVLAYVTGRLDQDQQMVASEDVATATGMDLDDVGRAALALQRRGLVEIVRTYDGIHGFSKVSGTAYVMTGLHPDGDDLVERLAVALDQAGDRTGDEDKRGRLRRAASALRDGAASVGGQVMAGVITAAITGR